MTDFHLRTAATDGQDAIYSWTADVTDDLSGVYAVGWFCSADSGDGTQIYGETDSQFLRSDVLSGTWTGVVDAAPRAQAETYSSCEVEGEDEQLNHSYQTYTLPAPISVPATTRDQTPPVVTNLSFDNVPAGADTDTGSVQVTFHEHITDDESGVWYGNVQCDNTDGSSYLFGTTYGQYMDRNVLSTDVTGTATLRQWSKGGTFDQCYAYAYDYAGNLSQTQSTVPVTNPPIIAGQGDQVGPTVTDFSLGAPLDGSAASTNQGPIWLTATATASDDVSGVATVGVYCQDPNTGAHISGEIGFPGNTSSTTVNSYIEIDQYTRGGTFTSCIVNGRDRAGNSGPAKTFSLAAPTSVSDSPDTTAPSVTGTPDRQPDGGTWYNHPVTISWTASDPAPSSGTPNTPPAITVSTDGANQTITSAQSCDPQKNCATGSYTVNYDSTAPTGTLAPAHAPDGANGWYVTPVTFTASCADATSGVATCPANTTLNTDGTNQTVTGTVTDNAGNTATLTSTPVNVDTTAPTGSYTPDRAPNSAGWYNAPVTETPTCADATSGVATCPTAQTISGDGKDQTVTGTVTDNAGNTSTITSTPVSIDTTAPTGTWTADRAPNAAGWYNGPVTFTASCTDPTAANGATGSGIATCPAPVTLSGDGANQTVSGTITDTAGNSTTISSSPVNIDSTGPTVTTGNDPVTPNGANGWYTSPVTVHTTCTDALSGVASCSKDQIISTNGSGQTVTGTGTDLAGNTTATTSTPVNVDGIAPQTSGTVTCPGNNGYCTSSTASLALTATDAGGSGVATITYRVNGGTWTVLTADHGTVAVPMPASGTTTVDFYATDVAGNKEATDTLPIKADSVPPAITHTINPGLNATGWAHQPTTVHFDATDDFSGVASVTPDTTVSQDTGPNGTTVNGTATDNAGNGNTDSALVKLDTTAPTISYTVSPALPASGYYTGPVKITFTCTDPAAATGAKGSGIASCPADQTVTADGANQTFTVSTTDVAGNRTTITTSGISIDTTPPSITYNTANNATATSQTISGTLTDAVSGVASAVVKVTGGLANGTNTTTTEACTGPSCTWTAKLGAQVLGGLLPQTYTVTITATDKAGNSATYTETVKY